ncbi:hypothetical protein CYMTET_8150 [Cymbomonas tetramitiformis]|uniref:Uncharacterized protein n=1 Tax=Cymbomonas tetramitiformis TaxID=36881 RepID=A0AAE0GU38_9CHLO|nr:hypothetical protein CYMTET_8150 [Cymbomonas tetramitiformis]
MRLQGELTVILSFVDAQPGKYPGNTTNLMTCLTAVHTDAYCRIYPQEQSTESDESTVKQGHFTPELAHEWVRKTLEEDWKPAPKAAEEHQHVSKKSKTNAGWDKLTISDF